MNSLDFDPPANSTLNQAHKRKSDSPLENSGAESSRHSGRLATQDISKRWKKFDEFNHDKTLEPNQPRPAKRLGAVSIQVEYSINFLFCSFQFCFVIDIHYSLIFQCIKLEVPSY